MKLWLCMVLPLLLALVGVLPAAEALPVPEPFEVQWEAQPEVVEAGDHARMVINGLWNFQPGDSERPQQPTEIWSWCWVPGSWHVRPGWNEVGVLAYGNSALWTSFDEAHREWPLGWYRREITTPSHWQGRRLFVQFSEVTTEVRVWLDGQLMGGINAKQGRVELTKAFQAGKTQELLVQVAAVPPNQPSLFLQGEMAEQVILQPAKLKRFGLTWDVELLTEPMGLQLGVPRIRTSVQKRKLQLSGSVSEMIPEEASMRFRVLDAAGKELTAWTEAEFQGKSWSTEHDWAPERFWDVDHPELLIAEVSLSKGDQLLDTRRIRFGFREIRIAGKEILLNEIPIRLRSVPHIDMPLTEAMVNQYVQGVKHAGFNTLMIHGLNKQSLFAEAADREGILLLAELPEIKQFAFRGGWHEGKGAWEEKMKAEMERFHHHPSIIMWWSGFNVFAHGQDQNPRFLGQDAMKIDHPNWSERAAVGWEALDLIRAADPSRPVYSHNASALGDMQTVNTYLNLIPLQEREEWLSSWAEEGTKPFLACEFGTPLNNTMMQGKAGGGWTSRDKGSANSASMMIEYCAIYFGPEAYRMQDPLYQDMIRSTHNKGFVHVNWGEPFKLLTFAEIHQQLQALFNENTFRSWRAWGMTGGVNPWSLGHGFLYPSWRENRNNISMGPYVPGSRGLYRPMLEEAVWKNFRGGFEVTPGGRALLENNQPLLAYIAGDAEQGFTDKDHHYHAGETLAKQVVLINDLRKPVRFQGTWKLILEEEELAAGEVNVEVAPGKNQFIPITHLLPEWLQGRKDGRLELSLNADGEQLTDQFHFSQYPFPKHARLLGGTDFSVMLIEGDGSSRAWLESLGITIKQWDPTQGGILVIGRGALDGDEQNIAAFRPWVQQGGRLFISSPSLDWLTEKAGFRVTPHPSRRMFVPSNASANLKLLQNESLRDWRGGSTRVEPYPEYEVDPLNFGAKPPHGWRWGNRGSVAYTMIEKPHHSGWIPWLEGEFDLAYSPLMMRPEGRGAVILSTLDLEDQVPVDPVARLLAAMVISDVQDLQVGLRLKSAYLGRRETFNSLKRLGLVLDAKTVEEAGILILGRGHGADDAQLDLWRNQGKRLLFLRRASLPSMTGWSWKLPEDHRGAVEVPNWSELTGLSIADFHFRAPYPMWTLQGEVGIGANGLIARFGSGIFATSIDPDWIRVDEQPFMRLTRWRHHRILTQILSGMGARFAMDGQIFEQRSLPLDRISLVGDWEATATLLLPEATSPAEGPEDPGVSDQVRDLVDGKGEAPWTTLQVPGSIDQVEAWAKKEGEFLFRLRVEVPENWVNQELVLSLGSVDDADDTYWNGERIGGVALGTPNSWSMIRQYRIPADQVKPGMNTIHVRAFDRFGGGGILGLPGDTHLRQHRGNPLSWYQSDYREDFAYGDDAYRYYRW